MAFLTAAKSSGKPPKQTSTSTVSERPLFAKPPSDLTQYGLEGERSMSLPGDSSVSVVTDSSPTTQSFGSRSLASREPELQDYSGSRSLASQEPVSQDYSGSRYLASREQVSQDYSAVSVSLGSMDVPIENHAKRIKALHGGIQICSYYRV